jgi:hypothetical protein
MMRKRWLKHSGRLIVFLAAAMALSSCAGGITPRVWIDEPLNGSQHALGEITIRYHAASETGVRGFVLYVNGEEYRRDQSPDWDSRIVTMMQSWVPPAEGQYTLQVVAYTGGREASEPATVQVTIGDGAPTSVPTEVAPEPTSPPLATSTPTLPVATDATVSPTETPVSSTDTPVSPAVTSVSPTDTPVSPTNTPPPSPTDTPPPAPTNTPPPAPTNTPPPAPTNTPPPTPTDTPTPEPDTAGPEISDISESADPIYASYPGGCSPTEVTITARVIDPSGVDRVRIAYRLAGGEWETQPMTAVGTGLYQATLPSPPGPTTLGYRIQARDTLGNQSNSSTETVEVKQCTGH